MKFPMSSMATRIITGALFALIFLGAFLGAPRIFSLILLGILITILATEWPHFFSYRTVAFWLITPFYPVLPFALLIMFSAQPIYHYLLAILFLSVFTFDTASYFGGTFLGRHKLAPRISPGKTWEGMICGIIATTALLLIAQKLHHQSPKGSITIALGIGISLIALAGDLFESWLKRRVNIKDSGWLLPGHGGFLDRFDAILFVTYFFYIARNVLIKII